MSTTNRPRTALIAVLGVIIAAVAFAGPASAAYEKPKPTVTVGTQTPAAGANLKFCGKGFTAGEKVTITLDDGTKFPSVTADSSGEFCTTLVLGITLTGPHTITATGATSGAKSTVSITVGGAAAGGTSGGTLAKTGAVVISIGALGVLLVLGGAMMLLAGRRRKVIA